MDCGLVYTHMSRVIINQLVSTKEVQNTLRLGVLQKIFRLICILILLLKKQQQK